MLLYLYTNTVKCIYLKDEKKLFGSIHTYWIEAMSEKDIVFYSIIDSTVKIK